MKHWIGRWLMGVSVLHIVFGVFVFHTVLAGLVSRGFVNVLRADPGASLAVWFVLFGVMLFICGMSVAAVERASSDPVPKPIGWGLLGLAVLGAILMPASGFWLVIPPAIAILISKPKARFAGAKS